MTKAASLGMYDHPAQRAANDRLWQEIAQILRAQGMSDVPEALDRSRPVQEIWHDPDLLFGQICGYPLISDTSLSLQLLALPMYDAPGCEGDTHRSFIVVREQDDSATLSDYRGRRAAINDRGSNSGMNLFRAAVAEFAAGALFFDDVVVTGSHRDSIRAIFSGKVDIAAIDVVTYAALNRFEPDLTAGLRIIAQTPRSPSLPFVTGVASDVGTVTALRNALAQVLADPSLKEVRALLFLDGLTEAKLERFAPLITLGEEAASAGYPELA